MMPALVARLLRRKRRPALAPDAGADLVPRDEDGRPVEPRRHDGARSQPGGLLEEEEKDGLGRILRLLEIAEGPAADPEHQPSVAPDDLLERPPGAVPHEVVQQVLVGHHRRLLNLQKNVPARPFPPSQSARNSAPPGEEPGN
jgi:hypothetical protein